jgi:hypothetical protein
VLNAVVDLRMMGQRTAGRLDVKVMDRYGIEQDSRTGGVMATTYIPLPDETPESESGKVWILGGLLGNSALSAKYTSFLVPLQSPSKCFPDA